jgi:alpha-beta hydrolase superfamily lysophospholipase
VIFVSEILFEQKSFPSADGVSTVAAYIWRPTHVQPRAIIQLSHGMCEYVQRYDAWARRFAEQGFVFCGNDHIGHGQSASDRQNLGFTAERGGAEYIVEDLHTMTALIKAEYEGLPVVLYGHSMGSFAARAYLTKYGAELAGALISGTAGFEQPTGLGLRVTHAIAAMRGARYRSPFLTSIAFGSYNKRFKQERDAVSWLTRDVAVRDRYREDPYCTFVFTAAGYDTLFSLLQSVSRKDWAQSVPKELPVLVFAGDMDPVGNYGKGVRKVYERLIAAGCNAKLRLYEDGRHEMHNELNRDEVFADLIAYLEEILV